MVPDRSGSAALTSPSRRRAIRRPNRLTASDDFQRARREGRSWANRFLVVRAVPNSLNASRFGFAVGKRVGKATIRNRIRRLMREAIRLRVNAIAPGWDVVLIAREPIREADFGMMSGLIEQLLQRAELFLPAAAEVNRAANTDDPD